MSTSDYRSVAAEGDLPISEAELAAMANQVFAASFGPGVRPGNDTPPQAVPRLHAGAHPTPRPRRPGLRGYRSRAILTGAGVRRRSIGDRDLRGDAHVAGPGTRSAADGSGGSPGQRSGCQRGDVGGTHLGRSHRLVREIRTRRAYPPRCLHPKGSRSRKESCSPTAPCPHPRLPPGRPPAR